MEQKDEATLSDNGEIQKFLLAGHCARLLQYTVTSHRALSTTQMADYGARPLKQDTSFPLHAGDGDKNVLTRNAGVLRLVVQPFRLLRSVGRNYRACPDQHEGHGASRHLRVTLRAIAKNF